MSTTTKTRRTQEVEKREGEKLQNQLVMLSPSELIPHPENPRKHPKSQIVGIAKSITGSGFIAPIIADRNRQILAGHGRHEASLLLKLLAVPVIIRDDLSPAQAKAYMLADNKLTDRSSWDNVQLATILKDLSLPSLEIDIETTGFESPEVDFRIQSLDEPDNADTTDEFEFCEGTAVSVLGDVWRLGDHSLCCGDALSQECFIKLLNGAKASAVFADPPYNVRINGHASGKGAVKHREFANASGEMSESEYESFLATFLTTTCRHAVPGALLYFCMDFRHMRELLAAQRRSDCDLINLCVWAKSNGGMGSLYRSQHELVFVLRNGTESHQNNIQLGKFGRNRTNVWFYAGANIFARRGSQRPTDLHPTVKPVLMVADAILDCTQRNEIVLDPCLGSGTTLLAAERTGRRCCAIEIDPLYVDTAIERWQKMTGCKALNSFGETFDFIKAKRRKQS